MKMKYKTLIIVIFTFTLLSCKRDLDVEVSNQKEEVAQSNKHENLLYGIIFREISEIPQLKDYEHLAGSVIYNIGTSQTDYKYGVSHFKYKKSNLIILEEIIKERNDQKVKYKILDTITYNNLKEDEYIAICTCRINSVDNSEIIAVVKADHDNEYFNRIVKAWRANTKTKKIIQIESLQNIDCINEGYGMDGRGEDENLESVEKNIEKDSIE